MGSQKYVFATMPQYNGQVSNLAAMAFYAKPSARHRVELHTCQTSLLANGFNILWAQFLNRRKEHPCDYFAMMHADVEPEQFWLDPLIDELQEKNLDVLSVVIPIKDQRGLTSTAVGNPNQGFCVSGRLSMQEVFRLPETFTLDDIPNPSRESDENRCLLINTGLWVCKPGDWCERVHFEVNDRIVWDEGLNRFMPESDPEDWNFSRFLAREGLRVGATKKVMVGHRGDAAYLNSSPWGQYGRDVERREWPLVPEPEPEYVNDG